MNHLDEERLILYYYGEGEGRSESAAHLEGCEQCRAEFASLQRLLDSMNELPVPERDAAYGSEVWRRVEPRLERRGGKVAAFPARRWIGYAAAAAMLTVAFYAGRYSQQAHPGQVTVETAKEVSPQVRERILLVAVGDHLERSRMVLAELTNGEAPHEGDISKERDRAQDLLEENRLYRQTALQSGDSKTAGMLDELERVLAEVAHSPEKISSPELDRLRSRIEDQGLLFKVRVVESNIRERVLRGGEPASNEGERL
jgi:hypothetical protein